MRIVKVVGSVTLNVQDSSFDRANLKVVLPLNLDLANEQLVEEAESLVAWDELNCGVGSIVVVSEGAEAARPFFPQFKPVDVYIAALLDSISLDWTAIRELTGSGVSAGAR
ncbi:MAG TPA: EutN/CcmL family microcompartment protein [Pirellulaceae bacterium]|nr:EutN/CcmL family microcompartment protein [Pirellulaceae bacterium]HMO91440.1 EutN/CcmL family microcompartment protein [Pirellulaceae bacterium]HMP69483.1 EutN/CcmL family microcompartment protein [Pirellulaceae bacterium]